MNANFFTIVLAGGSGTRLWPLSRQNFPKQFLTLGGELSLLQQTIHRIQPALPAHTLVITNEAHYFLCQEQLQSLTQSFTYLLEPLARNTAPAIACAAHYLSQQFNPDAVLVILPSDHFISDDVLFRDILQQARRYCEANDVILTLGIKPNAPKTGYGYIEIGEAVNSNIYQVKAFREKPDAKLAESFLKQQRYFWNAGIFIGKASVFLEEIQRFAPDIFNNSKTAVCEATYQHDFVRLEAQALAQCESQSIDYAIMEHTRKAMIMPVDLPWNDLGCWSSVTEAHTLDENANAIQGNVMVKDCSGCLINSDNTLVTTLGIKDQIIVATQDAVLVADKRFSQDVKEMVAALSTHHKNLLTDHKRVFRPWGYYEVLAEGNSFKVKRLMIKPKAKLSLQLHNHRAEHWVVVEGQASIINGEDSFVLNVNESTYIPQKTRHRLGNPGDEALYVIEVQSGSYLGEDDIIRLDDIYHRNIHSKETESA